MRILVIRGSNLASLAGSFALELDQPPLDKLGLFAITGATGAGKSTLLDAMCLALFDRTPRLEEGGGVMVGRAEDEERVLLTDKDVRGVLRRGATEGFAEVEFLGRDGRRYRARWAVKRAYGRVEGKLQDQVMSLTDVVTEKSFGGKKGEVLKAIEEKLGLSFDQFRRSALLAQGEFAAFLRAREKDRAELLERMTGTEVYSRMSLAAHQRHKQVQDKLTDLERGVAAISLMNEETRQREQQALVREEASLAEVRVALSHAEQAVRWYQARAEWVVKEREAQGEHERAQRAVRDAEPRRVEWERVRAAEDLRAPVTGLDEATVALAARETEWGARREEARAAREVERKAEAARTEAETRRDAAVRAEVAARPELEAAEKRDGEVERTQLQAKEAARKRDEARRIEEHAQAALAVLVEQDQRTRGRIEELQAWRDKRKPVEPVAREWSRWDEALQRYQREAAREAAAQTTLSQVCSLAGSLRDGAERRSKAHQDAVEALSRAEADVVQAESAQGTERGAERRQRREALEARRTLLKDLETARKGALEAESAEREALAEVEAARAECSSATTEAQAARMRRMEGEVALKEARRALVRTRDALGLKALRADLRAGEPCLLCGATEHPHARAEPLLEGLVEEHQSRVDALDARLQDATRAESSSTTRAEGASQRATQAEERRGAAAKRSQARHEEWRQGRERLVGARPPESAVVPEAESWLGMALADVRAQAEALKEEEKRAEDQARVAREARIRRDDARVGGEKTEKAWREADEALRHNVEAEAQGRREVEQAGAARQELLTVLASVFKDWPRWDTELASDGKAFQARCAKAVKEWNDKDEALRQEEVRARAEADKLGPARTTAELRHTQTEECLREAARMDEALAEARAARGALWGGRPTAEVRASLQREREVAAQALDDQKEAVSQAARAVAVAVARAEAAGTAREAAAGARGKAEATLGALLTSRALSLDTVRALLARGAAWCEGEERALAALRQARDKAQLLLEERQRQRLHHEDSAHPSLPEAEAPATLARTREGAEAQLDTVAKLKARLQRDDEERLRHGEQVRQLEEEQRKSGVWRTLSELIGSHDGKKFKVFAQSLTLDALLHYANAHLEELAPRYRLMRVPRSDLDLQVVDRDMGDEVRAVSSLSGGESFLVSLALALGLASLSSETTQVETLFIDEGFGTLDPETLEVALATLDALQATGRQVGIISHVSGLAERIGVQVRVEKRGAGRSQLKVMAEPGLLAATASGSRPALPPA